MTTFLDDDDATTLIGASPLSEWCEKRDWGDDL